MKKKLQAAAVGIGAGACCLAALSAPGNTASEYHPISSSRRSWRALKEFIGDAAVENIDKFIATVLTNPPGNSVLREIGSATDGDTTGEAKNTQEAEAQG